MLYERKVRDYLKKFYKLKIIPDEIIAEKRPTIFFSYSHADKKFVNKFIHDLEEREDISIWYDEAEINVGDSLIKKIYEGLYQSDYLGVILSRNSINSKWVQKELAIAIR